MCEECNEDCDYGYEDDYDYYDSEEEYFVAGSLDDSSNVNVERLLFELRHLTIFPEEHDQSLWVAKEQAAKPESACGSFGCLAGNVVVHENIPLYWYQANIGRNINGELVFRTVWRADYIADSDGEEGESIHNTARDLFGLNSVQAQTLFEASNERDDLWQAAETITNGRISRQDYADALRELEERKENKKEGVA